MDFGHMQGAPLVAGLLVLIALAVLGALHFGFSGSVQIS
jgi:hypothetical protein